MNAALIPILSLVGIIITGFVTWIVAKRQSSGSPEQTPAGELFLNMRSELSRLQGRVSEVEASLAKAESHLNVSQREVLALQEEASMLRSVVRELEDKLKEEAEDHEHK